MNNAEILQVTKESALQAYTKADDRGKALLVDLYGKKHFQLKITDRIKTFEDACDEIGQSPTAFGFTNGLLDEIAHRKLKVIAQALNENWTPDWNNHRQYKWYPWFYLNEPGFRFYVSYCDRAYSVASGGSRLCFHSEELANYAGKQFLEIYKAFLA